MDPDGSNVKATDIERHMHGNRLSHKKIVYIAGNFPNVMPYVSNAGGSDPKKLELTKQM